jgi:hypothetical protein
MGLFQTVMTIVTLVFMGYVLFCFLKDRWFSGSGDTGRSGEDGPAGGHGGE